MFFPQKTWKVGIFTALFIFTIDRVTKSIVMKTLPYGKPHDFLNGFIRCTYIRNPNSLFGLSFGEKFPYEILTGILTLLLIFLILKEVKSIWSFTYGLLLGGALGNGFDRIRMHEVVDFIDVGVSHNLRWPIFNVADSAVTIGIILIVILTLLEKRKKKD